MPRIEELSWDSAFFGVRIGRLQLRDAPAAQLREAVSEADRRGIDCLYWLVDASDIESSASACGSGFRLVDIRMTLETSLDSRRGPGPPQVRPMTEADVPALAALARSSHRDSRFFRDGNFPEQRCEALYEEWLSKAFLSETGAVLVAERDGQPAGYCACEVKDGAGRIGLIAVDPGARRANLGTMLVEGALDFFRCSGIGSAKVVTQGHNIGSQRLYQKTGFLTTSVELWYHRWKPDATRVTS